MAEFIFKKIVKDNGMEDLFVINSCATSSEEIYNGIGNPMYPPAVSQLRKNSIPFTPRQATRLSINDYEKYDLLVCMDSNNITNAKRMLGSDPEQKIKLLLSFTGENRNVSDPWYTGDFEKAFNDISKGCLSLYEYLTAE